MTYTAFWRRVAKTCFSNGLFRRAPASAEAHRPVPHYTIFCTLSKVCTFLASLSEALNLRVYLQPPLVQFLSRNVLPTILPPASPLPPVGITRETSNFLFLRGRTLWTSLLPRGTTDTEAFQRWAQRDDTLDLPK